MNNFRVLFIDNQLKMKEYQRFKEFREKARGQLLETELVRVIGQDKVALVQENHEGSLRDFLVHLEQQKLKLTEE